MIDLIEQELSKAEEVIRLIREDADLVSDIEAVAHACVDAIETGGKILLAGNGGSAADAQHWAAELVARFNYDRPGIPAIALTTDTSALTAIGNDYSYDYVFARQVEALGRKGDLFIGISTSGNSLNIAEAARAARKNGLVTVGLTGKKKSTLLALSDHCLRMPSNETPHIQEAHAVVGHILCCLIERMVHPRADDSEA